MDGYAVRAADCIKPGASLSCIGESAAGHPSDAVVKPGCAVRIFTGAVLPQGADAIAIQEDVDVSTDDNGERLHLREAVAESSFVRPAGLDVKRGAVIAKAGSPVSARIAALAAATGHASIKVWRKPLIGVLSTGDELVAPGFSPERGQIISSNAVYLTQLVQSCGGIPVDLGIAPDEPGAVLKAIRACSESLDIVVTTGGASVGRHDHVAADLDSGGAKLNFWRIAMRPGKPLIHGTVDDTPLLGLPGNPVSSAVCANIFLRAAIAALSGTSHRPLMLRARLCVDLPQNDRRQDYLRASLDYDEDGCATVTPAAKQDSSMMAVFANANALLVRPAHDRALVKGDFVMV